MIELGHIDISTKVYMLSSHNACPCEGHFEAALHIMSYFKGRHNSRLALDPIYPEIHYDKLKGNDWMDFYIKVKEAIPPNSPTPLDKSVDLRMMVDRNRAGDKLARKYRIGFLIFCRI